MRVCVCVCWLDVCVCMCVCVDFFVYFNTVMSALCFKCEISMNVYF